MKDKQKALRINSEKCKGCVLCVGVCPHKVLVLSKNVNKRGWQYVEAAHTEKCTACGLCVMMCPDCAIEIVEESCRAE